MQQSLQHPPLTFRTAYSVYAILSLNDTLPPFMTKTYALAPFRSKAAATAPSDPDWKVNATLYSLDLDCQEQAANTVVRWDNETSEYLPTTSFKWSYYCEIALDNFNNATVGRVVDGLGASQVYIKNYSNLFAGNMGNEIQLDNL